MTPTAPLAIVGGLLATAGTVGSVPASAEECPTPRTIASHPTGSFLENLLVEADGSVLYTSYFDRTVRRHRPDGSNDILATLDAHPVSLARRGGDLWVVAHGSSFAEGSAFMRTNRLIRIDGEGRTAEVVPAPNARFLNGMADLPGGDILIADSAEGVIWRFSLKGRALTAWLRDPKLLPYTASEAAAALPGANGVEIVGRRLLVSNTSRGELLEATIDHAGRPGVLRVFSKTGPIDDFHVDADGSVVAATHQSSAIHVGRDGTVTTILVRGADGSTATAPVPGRRAIYVLTTGMPFGGSAGPAVLLELPLPEGTAGGGGPAMGAR